MEAVWGPFQDGLYIAAYSGTRNDSLCYGYAKVCWAEPESYWEASCIFKVFGGENHPNEHEALHSAALGAFEAMSRLHPRVHHLAEVRRTNFGELPDLMVKSVVRPRDIANTQGRYLKASDSQHGDLVADRDEDISSEP